MEHSYNEQKRKYTLKGRFMSCQLFFDDIYREFYQNHSIKYLNNDIATKIEVPLIYGEGSYEFRNISNFIFMQERGVFNKDTVVHATSKIACAFITVALDGSYNYSILDSKKEYVFKQQSISIGFMREHLNTQASIKGKNIRSSFTFMFSKEMLLEYLIEFDNLELIKKLQKVDSFDIINSITLNSKHRYIIDKIFKNPYKGVLKDIYFQNNITQLLIVILEDLSTKKCKNIFLDKLDKNRLEKARTILLQDLQDPPTISELSHLVAINEDKLKKGFKTMFGNTIFKTLTEHRMAQALLDVKDNEMSIGEIAYRSGYENVSSFISVFKKTYGQTPGVMQIQSREIS